jgi:hypothetical protein
VSLTFSDRGGWHLYRLDDQRVPSVTTIINGGLPKPALVRWSAKVVAEAVAAMPSTIDAVRDMGSDALVAALVALPGQARNAAGVRGTEIHAFAEQVVHGEPVQPPADLVDAVAGYARWLDMSGFEPEMTEHIVGSRTHAYAGRFDVVGQMREERWLLDVKTSRAVYGDTSLQCAAYARADFHVDPADPDRTEIHMPRVERIGVLHVQPDVTELYDLGDIDAGFAEFLAAQTIYAGNRRRDELVRTPVQIADTRALF